MDQTSQQIDNLCDRFEEERRRNDSVRIEDFLDEIDEMNRDRLLQELIEIEIELVAQETSEKENDFLEPPIFKLQQSLLHRFPEQEELIDAIVRRLAKLRQIGDYEIIKELGHGGMGIVYKARQKLLNQIVAIKVLSQTLLGDPQAVGRFRREMQLIGRLNHPNIVRALNAGTASMGDGDDAHYLVMEFVDGLTLQQLCDKNRLSSKNADNVEETSLDFSGQRSANRKSRNHESTQPHISTLDGDFPTPVSVSKQQVSPGLQTTIKPSETKLTSCSSCRFSVGAACEAIRQAALGLQHAHEFGLVHRDIKPANLMLDRNGTVKILDLGLGKFLDDHRQPNEEASLTMAGTTIGTVDYISPEQCENAGDVDIRADLYSLGCTLYFLLTGKPPYTGSRYDTTRKKLMAHIVGEIPNVQKVLPEVPDELEKMLEKMLEKEPSERFQTPIEVAEALEPFASFDQLRVLSGGNRLVGSPQRSGSTSRISGTSQTRQVKATQKAKPYFPKPGSFSLGSWAIVVLPLLIALGAALLLPGIALTKHYFKDREKAEEIKNQLFNRGEQKLLLVPENSVQKETIQVDLAQLPGLNGSWWFNEIPWYLPFIRELILKQIDETRDIKAVLGNDPEKYYDPNIVSVYDWLWNIVQKYKDKLPLSERELLDEIKKYNDTSADSEDSAVAIQGFLDRFLTTHSKENRKNESLRAVDLHTWALLEHRLAEIRNDRKLAETATRRYREALERYRAEAATEEGKPQTASAIRSRRMEFLCYSDSARLEFLATGSYTKALQRYESVSQQRKTQERLSVLFLAELRAAEGTLSADAGRFDDSLFIRALDMLTRSKIGERMHPLSAQLTERYAWSLLEQWKVTEAGRQFEQALLIRGGNYRETNNNLALNYLLHDMHGQALTFRYQGNTNRAVEEYRRILSEIDPILKECRSNSKDDESSCLVSPGIRRFHASLRERAANSRERLADCVLYGGAASEAFSSGRLSEAAKLYAEAAELYDSEGPSRTMKGKQAIILLLQGNIDEANRILCDLDEHKKSLLGNQVRTELVRQVADALVLYKKNDLKNDPDQSKKDADRKRLLRQFLMQFSIIGNPLSSEASRRETLELRLFCAEFLADQALDVKDEIALKQDILLLLQPMGDFMNRPESRPFLRRICDLYARSNAVLYELQPNSPTSQTYLRGIVRLLKWMRDRQATDANDTVSMLSSDVLPCFVVFFIADDSKDSFVIFYPQDGRTGRLYRLALSRQQVKAGTRRQGSEWKLDDELLRSIREEREAGRPVNISWNDEASWVRSDDALHDSDWPFEELAMKQADEVSDDY